MLKRTPLFETHQQLGAKLIDFGGWEMPVQYTGIIEEHKAVRETAGLFDISHMGEAIVGGDSAETFLNFVLTNDVRKLADGEGQYTQLCNERGGTIDDLYVFREPAVGFLLVINASRIEQDIAWLNRQRDAFDHGAVAPCDFSNESDIWGAVALQGPFAGRVLENCEAKIGDILNTGVKPSQLPRNGIAAFKWDGVSKELFVSRTGYTGEDGFELICRAEDTPGLWNRLMEAGASLGVKPCGLGARDTLRTEVCYPLYGHELDEDTTPIEAGIGWSVALDKGNFIGRDVLVRQKEEGVDRSLVAFKMTGRSAPPRPGYPIWSVGDEAKRIGEVTSGTQSPSLGIGVGLGYVSREHARRDTPIEIEIRGRRSPATLCAKPIYQKQQTDT